MRCIVESICVDLVIYCRILEVLYLEKGRPFQTEDGEHPIEQQINLVGLQVTMKSCLWYRP